MAIDRTTKWRCQWQGKNGWANMLEIIPAGEPLNGTDLTVTTFSRSAFEMDFAEFGFDDLPIGMMKSQAASFSFVWANLPAGLKELLKTPQYTETIFSTEITTLFAYYNDEGTNTLILQYIGAQANTLGNSFELDGISTVKNCKIETFDLLKTILDTTKSSAVFGAYESSGIVEFPSLATLNSLTTYLVDFSDDTRYKYDILPRESGLGGLGISGWRNFLYYSIEKFRNTLNATIEVRLAIWTRSGIFGYEPTVAQTGYPDTSLTFYKQTQTDAHTKGDALDETNTLILGHVANLSAGNYISLGGFFSNDKEGVADFDSLGSFLAALCENFVCKLIYKPTTCVNATSGDTLLAYNMWWLKPLENVTSPVSYTPKITEDSYTISTAEKVFMVCESEIPNMAGDNINQNRVSTTVSDKADVWSAQMILHNCPTIALEGSKTPANMNLDPYQKYTIKISPRKLYYQAGASIFKVHESVVISDGVNTLALDSPTAFQNENWYDGILEAWVINTQNTQCLPQAIALYITTYWSKQDQALREFTCEMVNSEITPSFVGDYAALPAVTDIGANANSVLLTAKPDWDLGTMDCKYLSLGT